MPTPTASGSDPFASGVVMAEARRFALNCFKPNAPLSLSFCAQRAATPATCGVAMLVPFNATTPPRLFADTIPTPGAEIHGSAVGKVGDCEPGRSLLSSLTA